MSVNCHNSGRIGWSNFADSIYYKIKNNGDDIYYEWYVNKGKALHLCREIINTVTEFSETYKEEEENDDLNPINWYFGDCITSAGAQVSYLDSLLAIYVKLNLLLLDTDLNKTPFLKYNDTYYICMGQYDYSHDDYMANECTNIIKKIFGKTYWPWDKLDTVEINLSSKELVKEIKEYLKKVFICLIRLYQDEDVNEDFNENQFLNILRHGLYIKIPTSEEETQYMCNRIRRRLF